MTSAKSLYSSKGNNIAAYWGQGTNQERLGDYCRQKTFGIVMISFLNNWNSESASFNFGNGCWGSTCPDIETDIKVCQKLGIKVLLSLGGDAGLGTYGVDNDDQGTSAAQVIYNKFNPAGSDSVKPFGKAEIDGFDFDMENDKPQGLGAMVIELRKIWTSKTLLISATPQCPHPDMALNDLFLQTDAKLDFAFVQFYNNPNCALLNANGFNSSWGTWSDFVTSTRPDMKLFIALSTSCDSKYIVDINTVQDRTAEQRKSSVFGGYTIWEVTSATKKITNGIDYVTGLNKIVNNKKLPVSVAVNDADVLAPSSTTTSASPTDTDAAANQPVDNDVSAGYISFINSQRNAFSIGT